MIKLLCPEAAAAGSSALKLRRPCAGAPHRRLAYFQETLARGGGGFIAPQPFLEWPDGFGLPGLAGAGSCYNANSHYRLSVLAIAETEVGKSSL